MMKESPTPAGHEAGLVLALRSGAWTTRGGSLASPIGGRLVKSSLGGLGAHPQELKQLRTFKNIFWGLGCKARPRRRVPAVWLVCWPFVLEPEQLGVELELEHRRADSY